MPWAFKNILLCLENFCYSFPASYCCLKFRLYTLQSILCKLPQLSKGVLPALSALICPISKYFPNKQGFPPPLDTILVSSGIKYSLSFPSPSSPLSSVASFRFLFGNVFQRPLLCFPIPSAFELPIT